MTEISRRCFLNSLSHSVLVLSVFNFLNARKVFSAVSAPSASKWILRANDLAHAVKNREISALNWQREMEQHLSHLDLASFFKLIDFNLLAQRAQLPAQGEAFEHFSFKNEQGLPEDFHFYRNFAGFRKGRSIPPHAHNNLVSSFIVLEGQLHGRHFDRIRDEGDQILVKPTVDRVFKRGQFSTVSDFKDNVHWFTALEDRCFIFDLGISRIDPQWKRKGLSPEQMARWKADSTSGALAKTDRVYLDVSHGTSSAEDQIRASRLTHNQAYQLYG